MKDKDLSDLEKVTATVLSSSKYKYVDKDFVFSLGSKELSKRRNWKEAVKAVKNKLHQVGGAYITGQVDYSEILVNLEKAGCDSESIKDICITAMRRHTSTRERLPYLENFYNTIFNELPPIHSILDVACGLNPLARSWMPFSPSSPYFAVDIYGDMTDFINSFFELCSLSGRAWAADVLESPPLDEVDLAMVLKSLPCLEQIDNQAGEKLLDSLNSPFLLVSFPSHSLSGNDKGMSRTYPARFQKLAGSKSWKFQRFDFPGEIVFLINK
jgi:16S rRNA (guanine(1405)-N(7))-methyltransferase